MNITMLGSGSWKSSLSYRIIALGRELSRLGWTVRVIVPAADQYNSFHPDPNPRDADLTIIQPWQPATTKPFINLFPYIVTSLFALFRSRADIIYVYKPTPITILGLFPRLLFRTPVILDLDDLGSEVMKAQGQSKLLSSLVAACEQLAMRLSSSVIVASTYLGEQVRSKYPDKTILLLPNGVDIETYPLRPVSAPRPAIYYFGAINRLSLIEPLLRALPQVLEVEPTAQLQILGGGSALQSAKDLARDLGIAEAVSFSGWINMDEAIRYTRFADIAVCYQPDTPTVQAASNMKIFQYMAMGSVPVVSNVGDLAHYVRDGAGGVIVAPEDPEALAKAISDLLRDENRRINLATASRKLAETAYAWPVLAHQLSHFLTENLAVRNRAQQRRVS